MNHDLNNREAMDSSVTSNDDLLKGGSDGQPSWMDVNKSNVGMSLAEQPELESGADRGLIVSIWGYVR